MTKGNHRLKIADNDYLNDILTRKAKRQLRLVKIFKCVANILYKDAVKHPFKLACLCTFPTTTAVFSAGFIGLGLTVASRDYKSEFKKSVTEPVNHKLYIDFMQANFDGKYDVDMKSLRRHMVSQGKCHMIQNLYDITSNRADGWLKSYILKSLRKRMVKGELTLVS